MSSMPLSRHLQELRTRFIVVALWFLASLGSAFLFVQDVYRYLIRDVEQRLAVLGPSDVLWIYLAIAGVTALAATTPVAALQLWLYVKPGLHPEERRAALAYIPAFTLLFLLGVGFGYLIVFPMALAFLNRMAAEDFTVMYTAEKYFRFMIHMTVPLGLVFELPVVILFLTKLGILDPERLAKARKSSYLGLTILSVMLTPPDIVSDIMVLVPLFLLFEISLTLSRYAYRKKRRLHQLPSVME